MNMNQNTATVLPEVSGCLKLYECCI